MYSDRPSGRPKVQTVIDNIEQVMIMRYIDGMSLDKIASTIGASKETVRRDICACVNGVDIYKK